MSVTWSKENGPDTVMFGNPYAVDTTASFSQAGVYVLRLTADDTQLIASDTVTVTVRLTAPPDYDHDHDVDMADFGFFQACLSGANVALRSGCEPADLDKDNDVDQADFTEFQSCMGGPDHEPGC